jgi:hypothetical protein
MNNSLALGGKPTFFLQKLKAALSSMDSDSSFLSLRLSSSSVLSRFALRGGKTQWQVNSNVKTSCK